MAIFRSSPRRGALWLLALACGGAVARADGISDRYLAGIALIAPAGWLPVAGAPFTARLTSQDLDALLGAFTGSYPAKRTGGSVEVRIGGYAPLAGEPGEAQGQPSFLVDFDEPVFAELRKPIVAKYGAHPTPEQLAAFTDGYITNKNSQRGEDLASTVARRKEGDCTEHAVLLAALVRLFGGTSRLINGVAFIAFEKKPYAFGHQWVEVAVDGKWKPFDGTRPSERPDGRWLPLTTVSDESMRRGMVAAAMLSLQPSKITVE
jgi:Transglutaminase-like superfamily